MEASSTTKPTKDTLKELLQSQTSAEESTNNSNSSNEELIQREKIEGTPFELINRNNTGWFLALGRYRMSVTQENTAVAKERLIRLVERRDWYLVVDTIAALTECMIAETKS